jgi:phosphoribosyl-dephospho-CoA transferase
VERAVTATGAARTHDLLRLRAPGALIAETLVPPWAWAALWTLPWVVVRRGRGRGGLIPVGVRGAERAQRFAGFVAPADVADRRSPEDLAGAAVDVAPLRRHAVPALDALARVAPVLSRSGHRWGPGGSVGFEIATGVPTATAASDLDLVMHGQRRLDRDQASALLTALADAAWPACVDALLETSLGGVSLADLAASARVLVRTPDGPRLCDDPWTTAPAIEGLS